MTTLLEEAWTVGVFPLFCKIMGFLFSKTEVVDGIIE
jgi:hypothetical protein